VSGGAAGLQPSTKPGFKETCFVDNMTSHVARGTPLADMSLKWPDNCYIKILKNKKN
jgi:hypothetical protein